MDDPAFSARNSTWPPLAADRALYVHGDGANRGFGIKRAGEDFAAATMPIMSGVATQRSNAMCRLDLLSRSSAPTTSDRRPTSSPSVREQTRHATVLPCVRKVVSRAPSGGVAG